MRTMPNWIKAIMYANFGLLVIALLPDDENPPLLIVSIVIVLISAVFLFITKGSVPKSVSPNEVAEPAKT